MSNKPRKRKKIFSKKDKICLSGAAGVFLFAAFIFALKCHYVTSEWVTTDSNATSADSRSLENISTIANHNCGHFEISELKNLLKTIPNLRVPSDSSEFIGRFLTSEKCDVAKAFDRIRGYFEFPVVYPDFFGGQLVPSKYVQLLETNLFGYLEDRDQFGRLVLFGRPGQLDLDRFTVVYALRALRLYLEMILERLDNGQMNGVVVIADYDGLTMSHVLNLTIQLTIPIISQSACFLQNCLPVRYEAIHVINAPWVANILIKMVVPFLSEDTKQKLILHESNRLTEYVDPAILPVELGGRKPSFNASREIDALLRWEPKWTSFQAQYGFETNENIDAVNVC